jgi:hypothetical protein
MLWVISPYSPRNKKTIKILGMEIFMEKVLKYLGQLLMITWTLFGALIILQFPILTIIAVSITIIILVFRIF